MTDNTFPGPMTMIKIDGAKIKRIRESQGLTQLYLATAVQVTTDTISRWENRRYPSIKRENGLKLAEALNVQLEDILEESRKEDVSEDHKPPPPQESDSPSSPGRSFKKVWPILILSATLMAIVMAFLFYSLHSPLPINYSAKRLVPSHCIAGQPFPVVINVLGEPNTSTSLIIREKLPSKSILSHTSPPVSSASLKNQEIKWLKKVNGFAIFAYLMTVEGNQGDVIIFDGTASIGRTSNKPAVITGDLTTVVGSHHWADTDKNNSISDNEILVVYEQYSDIKDIDLNIDLIEEIWLGSGYRWNASTASFDIFD